MLNNKGFDLWAEDYDKSVKISEEKDTYPFAGYKEVLNKIYQRIREQEGKTVLDIGFGTGVLTKKLYDDGVSITGIDFSEEMIKIAKEKMPTANLIQWDFTKGLPEELEQETFDFIICTYAIHHLSDDGKVGFLKLLSRHLNENGEILLGDVMFQTREELEKCKAESKEQWDQDEIYMVMDEFMKEWEKASFYRISDCSGVCQVF